MPPMKYWEIVSDQLSAARWSLAVAAPLPKMAGVGIVDGHRGDRRRYIVHFDELLTAFLELGATLL
jgi:hypothetical protein